MKANHFAILAVTGLILGGCAGSVSAPTAVQPLAVDASAPLRISEITADAAPNVQVGDDELGLIAQKVKAYVQAEAPAIMADQGYVMKIHVTRFDRGNAFARAMLIGLGQIHIEGTVDINEAGGKLVAEYKVSKDFAIGGVIGASTTVSDVEDGFAKSVAEIVKGKG